MKGKFTITKNVKFTAIRCHSCNQTESFTGEDIENKLEDFRRDHAHQERAFNKDRFFNKVIGNFGE